MAEPVKLWRIALDGGGSVAVYVEGRRFRVRAELPNPDYLGPDVVGERYLTRERFRQLWLSVNWRRPYGQLLREHTADGAARL